MTPIAAQITRRIRAKKRGWVFTPKDFLDLGPRTAVDQALSRLVKKAMIRRLDRGFYDYPKQHQALGTLSPDTDMLAQATASRFGDKVFPSGATAANMLGLSTQVPARPVYLTDGPSRTKRIGNRTITLKHARIPLLDRLSPRVNSVLQALAYLGKDNIDGQVLYQCANLLSDQDIARLLRVAPQLPTWITDTILRVRQLNNGSLRSQG